MNTTIQISKETKELISTFGSKGDTYEEIIKKLYQSACENELKKFMEPSKNYMSLEEFGKLMEEDD